MLGRLRGMRPDGTFGLRPAYPSLALELDGPEAVLVRLRRRRRAKPLLEVGHVERLAEPGTPASPFEPAALDAERLAEALRALFAAAETRPGRLSLVLPDNMVKLSLLQLPERPAGRRHLEELIRFKMRRAVPFRMSDAAMSYQILPAEGPATAVLVALVRRELVELYERALEALGARPGLVDLATPNLINLCRRRIQAESEAGHDVALLNCTAAYFSLVILRQARLIFFRCKTFGVGDGSVEVADALLAREVEGSLAYYREKLAGAGVGTLLLRSVGLSPDDVRSRMAGLEFGRIESVDPAAAEGPIEGPPLAAPVAQRLAPAVGAALGRS
jgi:type IV pilus assembly protein PilM